MDVDNKNLSKIDIHFHRNVVLKALFLFITITMVFAFTDPKPLLGRISAYNILFPGRLRLPYGDNPAKAYNLSLNNLEAMFASHVINSGPKPDDEFRIIFIGDSSTWGFLLGSDDTLTSNINKQHLSMPDGRAIVAYNLGFPVMSLTKDLLILSYAKRYQPDLIVWLFTLESFPPEKQLFAPLLQNNPDAVRKLIQVGSLKINLDDPNLKKDTFWSRTLFGQRRALADLFWLQLYGIMWAASGKDQYIPETYTFRQEDLLADYGFHDLGPPSLSNSDLAIDVLQAGKSLAGDAPILYVNEPMFISQGKNSHIRYNFYYPRWAYDDYRTIIWAAAQKFNWWYLDYWNVIPEHDFTNTAIHLSPDGSRQLAELLGQVIIKDFTQYHQLTPIR